MLKLVCLVVGEKVLAAQDGTLSIICVVSELTVPVPAAESLPPDALGAIKWAAGVVWLVPESSRGVDLVQELRVARPSGAIFGPFDLDFAPMHRYHRTAMTMDRFPVGEAGTHFVEIGVRQSSEATEWHTIARYPIEVRHSVVKPDALASDAA